MGGSTWPEKLRVLGAFLIVWGWDGGQIFQINTLVALLDPWEYFLIVKISIKMLSYRFSLINECF